MMHLIKNVKAKIIIKFFNSNYLRGLVITEYFGWGKSL